MRVPTYRLYLQRGRRKEMSRADSMPWLQVVTILRSGMIQPRVSTSTPRQPWRMADVHRTSGGRKVLNCSVTAG